MPKLTLEEKRLETLRRQLYGKSRASEPSKMEDTPSTSNKLSFSFSPSQKPILSNSETASVSTDYLKKDLLKIFFLSSLALGLELALYIGSKNHLLNLHF